MKTITSTSEPSAGGLCLKSNLMLLGILLMLALGYPAMSANAAVREWTGNDSDNWSNPNNWSPNGVPQNGESLLFHNGSILFDSPPMNNDLTDLTVSSMQFTCADVFNNHWVIGGNTLSISRGVFNDWNYDSQVQINCGLKLAGNATFVTGLADGSRLPIFASEEMDMRFTGPIDLNGHNLALLADYDFTKAYGHIYIDGGITGSGNVAAIATAFSGDSGTISGTIEFKGTGSDFSGTLTLGPWLGSTILFNVTSGVVVNNRLVVTNVGTVKLERSEQIGDGATVHLQDGATLSLNNHAESILNLELVTDSNDSRPAILDAGETGLLGLYGNIAAIGNNSSQTPAIKGKITLTSGEHDFNVTGSAYAGLDMQAQILGDGNFSKTGNAALLLTASNNCNSSISVVQGILDVRHPHALGDTAGPTQLFGGALMLRNVAIANETLFALGQGTGGAFPGSVLTSVGASSWSGPVLLYTNLVVSGNMDFRGVISGAGGLGCFGLTTVHLTGNNTYTGTNYVSGATLQVDGVQPSSPVDLHDQGRLQGPGTVGNINVKGTSTTIAPGSGPGILTCKNLDASGGNGQLEIELNGTTPGIGYDQLNPNGSVNLTGLSLIGSRSFLPSQEQSFTIVKNDSSETVIGTFNGLRQDSQTRIGNEAFHVNYTGGDGNDVVLTRVGHDITWTNNASGDWNVAANWSPNRVPGTNDTVFINKTITVTLNTTVNCYNLSMGISGGSPTLTGAGDLTLFVLDLDGFNLSGSLTVKVLHQMNWTGGMMSGNGRTIIAPGARLNIPSSVTLNTRTLENGGTILWTGGNVSMGSGVITNRAGALFEARTATDLNLGASPGSRFDNAGTFRKAVNAGTIRVFGGMAFNNYGAVDIQAGTLSLFGGGTHTGTFDIPAGTTLNLSGVTHTANAGSSITGAGNLYVSGGNPHTFAGLVNVTGTNQFDSGTANLTGNYICTNNTLFMSGGTANFNGSGTITPAVINMDSGTLGGNQTVSVLSQMNWTGGTMTGSGRTIIPATATLNIASTFAIVSLSGGRILENGGTILWTGGNFAVGSSVITNRAGALFEARNALGLNYGSSPGSRFDNAGTFRKSVNTGTMTISLGMVFNNYNTVDLQAGILAANGGYNSTPGSKLLCALGGTTPGTGHARLQAAGPAGTVALNGALGVSLLPGFTPAVNDAFTVVAATARNGTFTSFNYPADRVTMLMSNTPNSVVVRVTGVTPIPRPVLLTPQLVGTNTLLTWTTLSNVAYRLEFNPSLAPSNWNALAGDVIATSNTASKLDALTTSNRFYRVRVLP